MLSMFFEYFGKQNNSVLAAGAGAAFIVGTVHFICGLRFGLTLILFFLSASRVRVTYVLTIRAGL